MRQGARRLAEMEFDREKTYARFADWLEAMSGRSAPAKEDDRIARSRRDLD